MNDCRTDRISGDGGLASKPIASAKAAPNSSGVRSLSSKTLSSFAPSSCTAGSSSATPNAGGSITVRVRTSSGRLAAASNDPMPPYEKPTRCDGSSSRSATSLASTSKSGSASGLSP